MGIDYRIVQVVGVDYDKLTFENMTEEAKQVVRESYQWFIENSGFDPLDDEELGEWLEEDYHKTEFITEDLGFDTCGNGFSGDMWFAGVSFEVSLGNTQSSIDDAVKLFKKYFNLEPVIQTDIDIY